MVTLSAPPSVRSAKASVLARSIVMLATLRVTRTWRLASAETAMSSPMLEPLKSCTSMPDWPSTTSEPSPGSHWKWSLPAPMRAVSAPMLPSIEVVAVAAEQEVGAVAAAQHVLAVAAVLGEVRERADAVLAGDRVVGLAALDDELLDRARAHERGARGERAHQRGAVAGDADLVVVAGAGVGRGVRARAAVGVDARLAGGHGAGDDRVVAVEQRRGGAVLRLGAGHAHDRLETGDDRRGALGAERHAIGPVRALGDHVVDRGVAGAVEPGEVHRDVAHGRCR